MHFFQLHCALQGTQTAMHAYSPTAWNNMPRQNLWCMTHLSWFPDVRQPNIIILVATPSMVCIECWVGIDVLFLELSYKHVIYTLLVLVKKPLHGRSSLLLYLHARASLSFSQSVLWWWIELKSTIRTICAASSSAVHFGCGLVIELCSWIINSGQFLVAGGNLSHFLFYFKSKITFNY